MPLVAGIDSSTQSCKVVIRDSATGALVRQGRASHPEGTEVHPEHWWSALQEALANGIRHGCKGDPTKHVQCSVTFNGDGELVIVVRDPGTGFDTSTLPNPLDEANMLKPSGRGVFLINQLMDEVAFRDGGREVAMRKRREPKPVTTTP